MSVKSAVISVVIGAALGSKYFSTFDSAEKRAHKLGNAFAETNKKLNAAKDVVKYQQQLENLKAAQQQFGLGNTKLWGQIAQTEKHYRKAVAAAEKYGLAIGDIVKEQKKLSVESAKLERNLKRLENAQAGKDRLAALKGRAIPLLGAAYAGGRAIGSAVDVEQAGIRLKTVINAKDTEQAVIRSMVHAKAFASKTLASEGDVLAIEYALNSSGLDEKAARFGSEIVSKVAKVTSGNAEDVGFIIGDTYNNLADKMTGTVEDKLKKIGDVLTKTQFKYSIKDFNQLGESFKSGSAAMLTYNVSLEQTSAILGQLNSSGIKGSEAGTGFNAVLRQMAKASDELGFAMVRNQKGELDMMATLENLKASLDGLTIDEKAAILQKNFGDEGLKGIAPLLSGLDKLKSSYDDVLKSSGGIVDKSYQDFVHSTGGQMTMFSQNLSMIGSTLAGTVLPAVNGLLTPVAKLAGWTVALAQEFPIIGKTLGLVSVVAIGYGVALASVAAYQWLSNAAVVASTNGLLGQAIAFTAQKAVLIGGVAVMKTITAAQWLWNAAMTANPIGLIVAGVAAFGALAYTVYKNWEPIMAWFTEKFGFIGKTVGWIGDKWSSVFGSGGNATGNSNVTTELPQVKAIKQAEQAAKAGNNATTKNDIKINIQQNPGEDQGALAKRVAHELARMQQQQQRGALYDGV